VLVVAKTIAWATSGETSGTNWFDALIYVGIQVVFYHRLGRHVRDVARSRVSRAA
jgi:hypothetical protein